MTQPLAISLIHQIQNPEREWTPSMFTPEEIRIMAQIRKGIQRKTIARKMRMSEVQLNQCIAALMEKTA